MALAQNGWPASADKVALGIDSKFAVAGVTFPGGVKAGDVAVVLRYVLEQFHAHVEPLRAGECWGFAYREVRSGSDLSNHSAGCAVDVNAPRHPLGKAGTFTPAQVSTIHKILGEVGGVVRWGGDYSGRKDEMHFEIVGSTAQVAAVAARLRAPAPTTPTPGAPSRRTLREGDTGEDVWALQDFLNRTFPSYSNIPRVEPPRYGPKTVAVIREFQSRVGLVPDGVCGAVTYAKLGGFGLR